MQGKFSQVAVEGEDEDTIRTPSMADLLDERSAMLEAMKNEVVTLNETFENAEPLRPPGLTKEGRPHKGTRYLIGKRAKIVASSAKGRYTYYQPPKEKPWDIALAPTLRAASLFQKRRKAEGVCVVVEPEDIQAKIREYRAPFSIALVVDMSFSMTSSLENTGRAIFSLHRSVYRRRDRVSLIVFKGKDAVVLQQPTTNLDMAVDKLRKVEASDFTPMATGLLKAWRLLRLEKQRNKDAIPMLIVMSDGIANVALSHPFSSASRMNYASEAQADAIDMARILKRDGIRVIVINTSHRSKEIAGDAFRKITSSREWFTPTELMLEIARITDGSYYGLRLAHDAKASIRRSKLDDWFFFEAND
jgi:magnesium chelatase subunit D